MELKKYQEEVLKDLDSYLDNVLDTQNASAAYKKTWEDKGVRVGGQNALPSYKDVLRGIPSVCLKVPTGGGKTILGCASLKHIFDRMSSRQKRVVVWLVPWDTILTQTYSTLSNQNHFYRQRLNRDFASRVEIYTKQQALSGANFNPSAVNDQLSIILMSFDSLRSNNKDNRKVYEENSNLASFVSTYDEKETLIKGVDETSLMQVLNQLKPVVIIDESHNAKSDLSKEMIKNLCPSFVLELTATPKDDSNIISIVSADKLKEENMVKLPVIAYNRPSVSRVLMEAIDLRNSLEAVAIEEMKNGCNYIRPIVLFQAQPKNDDDETNITFEKLKDALIKDAGISKDEIAIKTATKNELQNVDLLSPNCKIRYIITINALKEGWDCPFAYVLASLANKTSKIDVEQILGRILRQPHQKHYTHKVLNMSYVLTSSNDFNDTLKSILEGLHTSGFSKNDCRTVRTNTLDNLENRQQEDNTVSLFDYGEDTSDDVDNAIFSLDEVGKEIRERERAREEQINQTTDNDISENENINRMLEQAEKQSDEYEEIVNHNIEEGEPGVPDDFKGFMNIFKINSSYREEINNLRLPTFSFKKTGILFDDDNSIYRISIDYLNQGFDLSAQRIPSSITTSTEDIYQFDVETTEQGSVVRQTIWNKNESDKFKEYLNTIPEEFRVNQCKKTLINYLNNKFDCISEQAIHDYVERIVSNLKTEDEVVSLQNNIFSIGKRIEDFIKKLLEEYRYDNFKTQLNRNEIFVSFDYELAKHISPATHTSQFPRSLYEEEDAKMNDLELKFAGKVASLENVDWWHRIIEKNDYCINGFINHYPDFIIKTKNGTIVLVETKGEHLDGDDSKKKLELGNIWSAHSTASKYKYFMAFEKKPLNESGADLLDNIIATIKSL